MTRWTRSPSRTWARLRSLFSVVRCRSFIFSVPWYGGWRRSNPAICWFRTGMSPITHFGRFTAAVWRTTTPIMACGFCWYKRSSVRCIFFPVFRWRSRVGWFPSWIRILFIAKRCNKLDSTVKRWRWSWLGNRLGPAVLSIFRAGTRRITSGITKRKIKTWEFWKVCNGISHFCEEICYLGGLRHRFISSACNFCSRKARRSFLAFLPCFFFKSDNINRKEKK